MQRIGVFICWCGSNIAATVDVERVSAAIKAEPGVVFSADYQYIHFFFSIFIPKTIGQARPTFPF